MAERRQFQLLFAELVRLIVALMKFCYLSRDTYGEWDTFVDQSPQGSLFAKTYYLSALGASYRIGALIDQGKIYGGIVLAKNEIGTFSNPLFAKYLGVLVRPIEGKYVHRLSTEKQIVEKLVSKLAWCKTFDYTFHPSFINWLPFYWNGYRQETRYTYIIQNLQDMDKVLNQAESRVRKNLRKAERHAVEVTHHVPLDTFYQVNRMTYRRQGGKIPFSFELLERIYSALNARGAIKLMGAVDKEGNYHAVCGLVHDQRSCFFILNGVNPTLPNYEANTLLVIKALGYASRISASFDFEGSMLRPIEKFYRGFGARLTPYFHIWKDNWVNSLKQSAIRTYKKIQYGR